MSFQRNVELLEWSNLSELGQLPKYQMVDSNAESDRLGVGAECISVRRVGIINDNQRDYYAFKEMTNRRWIQDALYSHLQLKQSGVAVPDTYLGIGENDRLVGLLMTDLTRDWKDLFVNSNTTREIVKTLRKVNRKNPHLIEVFADLNLEKGEISDSIDHQAHTYADLASRQGIEFQHFDVPSAVVQEGGIKILISDMGNVAPGQVENYQFLYKQNFWVLDYINAILAAVQDSARSLALRRISA